MLQHPSFNLFDLYGRSSKATVDTAANVASEVTMPDNGPIWYWAAAVALLVLARLIYERAPAR
jgi:hypothetical protein